MNEIKQQLKGKRFFKVLLPGRESTLGLSQLVTLGCCDFVAKYQRPSMSQIARMTGICRDTVGDLCRSLFESGYLDQGFNPQYERCAGELDTFQGKAGREYKYLIFYPPSAESPLKWIGHAIYSFLLGFTGDRLCDRYIGQVLSISEETISKYLGVMEKESMIAVKRQKKLYCVGFYELGQAQLRFFADVTSKTEEEKGVVYLGKPPGANGKCGDVPQVCYPKASRSSDSEKILSAAEKQIEQAGFGVLDTDDILSTFTPLAEKGVWFDAVDSYCSMFRAMGNKKYKEALMKTIEQRRKLEGV